MNRARWLVVAVFALLASAFPVARAAGPNPTIVSVVPAKGPSAGGTTVTITGTDFVAPMGVTFGSTPATDVVVTSPTTLTCKTAAHARGSVSVLVSQTTLPVSNSPPSLNAFTYEDPPYYLWVPRALGSSTGGNPGGFDVTIVDVANRAVVGKIDLNAAEPDLPTDDDWRVTQVLFDTAGATAFLATSGTPGVFDSQKIFVVKTARAIGAEAGNPVLAVIDTNGNPYQLALSSTGNRLYAVDGGAWTASSTILPNGTFRAWDVTDRANPVSAGTPAAVGVLPALAYDAAAYQGWGTNSSFKGTVQSKGGICVVTNVGSHSLSIVDTATLGASATVDVANSGASVFQLSTSTPNPYLDDFVFIQSTGFGLDANFSPVPLTTEYFIYRISLGTLTAKGAVSVPMRFFQVVPAVPPTVVLENRQVWPHPDGESMVAVPAVDPSLATWNPATGGAGARTAIQGGGPPTSLALNDKSGFYYAREADGGWTVFSVDAQRGAPPVVVVTVPDATGLNSFRVVGDGTLLAATAASTLALIDGKVGSPSIHAVTAVVTLPMDPAGGPSFPQPGTNGGPARTFVTVAGPSTGPRVIVPLAGTEFCADDAPPEFEIAGASGTDTRFEIELGTQYDFLPVPGSVRLKFRVPVQGTKATPSASAWKKILRNAAGSVARPFFARVVAVSYTGYRTHGASSSFRVCAPTVPVLASPDDNAALSAATPPAFIFDPGQEGTAWLIFNSASTMDRPYEWGRVKIPVTAPGPVNFTVPAKAWKDIAAAAKKSAKGEYPAPGLWTVEVKDALGRTVPAAESRAITVND